MSKVDLGRTVDYETLEEALLKAAEEVGWKAKVKDRYRKRYKLGPVEESQEYEHTMISLRGRLFPMMKVHISDKRPTNDFYIWTGFPFGIASEKKIKQYLEALDRNLG